MLLLLSLLFSQSLPSSAIDAQSNTCLRRSVAVYTQGAATYVVTDLGSTSLHTGPTICPNVSTVLASTVTVYQQPATSGPVVVTDAGFENGQDSPFNTSASGPQVSAQVAQSGSGPLQPYSGDSFLLITFNNSGSEPPRAKRQITAPQVYNVTQNFAATAGLSYSLSAYAASAPVNGITPGCSIMICGDSTCGPSTAITAGYSPYTYRYNAGVTESGAVATFSVSCPQSAYVALDNVTVTARAVDSGSLPSLTTTIIQFVTRTQTLQAATQTTQQIGTPSTEIRSVTNTTSMMIHLQ